jgi:complex iron-sulfur molybdoenzyme family reductase subunit gamma
MRAALLALLLVPAAAPAAEDPLADATVVVKDLPGPLAADPAAAAWDALPALEVAVAPQRTVHLPDAKANAALAAGGPRSVKVRAATDGKDLALVLDWADPTEDRAADETDRYGDSAAIQFPQRYGPGVRLPYVGMGDAEQPVVLHLLRAGATAATLRSAVAAGFGSTTRADLGDVRAAMRWKDGAWRAVLVRPLASQGNDLARGLVPFAVAVWDGGRSERGGNKALSPWRFLRLARLPADAAYAAELAWGRRPGDLGDAARGRQLVEGMCAACHRTAERRAAKAGIAPDLAGIGAIATPAYLRDSIVAPSSVVVPGRGWSRRDAAGKIVSNMPAYATMPAADVNAMVAYLVTLGAPAPGRSP